LEVLSKRIYERFPQSGLFQVSDQLLAFGRNVQEDSIWVAKPIVLLRIASGLLVLLFTVGAVWTLRTIGIPDESPRLMEFVMLLEAGINDVILISAGIFFLLTAEIRIKRRRALNEQRVRGDLLALKLSGSV
jgi:hypothetical protein